MLISYSSSRKENHMFVVKFVPHSAIAGFVAPITFVTHDVETAKATIAERLGEELVFDHGIAEIETVEKDGEKFCHARYDTTGTIWTAMASRGSHVRINPIELVES